jgi:hypothetical protein
MASKKQEAPKGKQQPTGKNGGTPNVPMKSDTALVLVQDEMPDYLKAQAEGNRGSENVGTEDLVIPRLEVIQAISPEVTAGQAEYIEAARPGMLMNSVTKRLFSEAFIVPVYFHKLWLVWKDRKQGGGFFGAYSSADEAEARAEKEGGVKAGIEVMDTPTHVCLLIDRENGTVDEVMVAMPRTKAKVSRQWNSMVKLAGGDRFSRVYRLTTQSEKNQKGSYFNYVVAQSGFPAKALYEQAEKLYNQIAGGERKVVMDTKNFDRANEGLDERNDM